MKAFTTALVYAALGLASPAFAQSAMEDWTVDPIRGPVDMGLADPSLMGAIDVHLHVDPDAPGRVFCCSQQIHW